MEKDFCITVLAAGFGTRMKSNLPKVLHEIDSKPMIIHILEKAITLNPASIIIVVGYKGEMVKDYVENWFRNEKKKNIKISFVFQEKLEGSGRAVFEARNFLKNYKNTLVLSGDVPFIEVNTLKRMINRFYSCSCDAVVLTCNVENPSSYGRILKDVNGNIKAIVEASDANIEELKIKEINSGIYFFKTKILIKSISSLKPKGPKKEYYLTDSIENIIKSGGKVINYSIDDDLQIKGINSRIELSEAFKFMVKRKIFELQNNGVSIISPENTFISSSVKIGKDSIIYPGCIISGKTVIGENCKIGAYSIIENSKILDNVNINPFSCIYNSIVKNESVIGPFSHIRPLSNIGPKAKVGNFSEIKKSKIGKGSKVPHLSYIGDTIMGERVNIGAGTITCNYDGIRKNKTLIDDEAFIGSNTNLVAPIKIGKKVLIGAGSTITENVPDNKLAIARARQVVKDKR